MIYTILISIVFLAEIIITITIAQCLIRLDKAIIEADETISFAKPTIKDISELIKKISEQYIEFSTNFAEKLNLRKDEIIIKQVLKAILGIFLVKTNVKLIKKIRSSKIARTLAKGLSLLEIMV